MRLNSYFAIAKVIVVSTLVARKTLATGQDDDEQIGDETRGDTESQPTFDEVKWKEVYRPNQSPYKVKPAVSLTIITTGFVVVNVPRLMVNEIGSPPWCGLECDKNGVNGFDKLTLGASSQTAADISDYVIFGALTLPFIFDAIDVGVSNPGDGWKGYAKDTLVLLETMGVTLYVNGLVAMIVRRPRPYVYDDNNSDEFRLEPEAAMSFYSGHTSIVFAAATAYSNLFMARHPESKLVVPMWLVTQSIATTVGVLRVASSAHFMSDVIVGAISGVGFGLLIPWLHKLPEENGVASEARVQMRPCFSGISCGVTGSFF